MGLPYFYFYVLLYYDLRLVFKLTLKEKKRLNFYDNKVDNDVRKV